MKASFCYSFQYLGVGELGLPVAPPVPNALFEPATGIRSTDAGIGLAALADDLGFDWVSLSEHHYSPRIMTPNPMIYGAALSQVVRRARIAILGANLPMLNPIRVAEEFAMLDVLTAGRAVIALLRGTPPEYASYSTNPAESRARYEEGVDLVLHALRETQPFGWEGRYYQYRTVSIWPRPVQPAPTVFVSGNSTESGTLAAAHRTGMGLSFNPLMRAQQLIQHYRGQAAAVGWEPTADEILYRGAILVDETDAAAIETVRKYRIGPNGFGVPAAASVRDTMAGMGVEGPVAEMQPGVEARFSAGPSFCGGPDTVAAQIRAFRDAGVGIVDLMFGYGATPREITERSMTLFAKEVLPQIRGL